MVWEHTFSERRVVLYDDFVTSEGNKNSVRQACRLTNLPILNISHACKEDREKVEKLYEKLPVAPIDEPDERGLPFVFFNFKFDTLYIEDIGNGFISRCLPRFGKVRNLAVASDGPRYG